MHWGWAGETPRFRKNIKKFDWDITPVPTGPQGMPRCSRATSLWSNQHSEHTELAWEFVKYMTGPEAELLLGAKFRRCVPTRLSVQQHPEYLKSDKPPFHNDVFLETVRRGRTLPLTLATKNGHVSSTPPPIASSMSAGSLRHRPAAMHR